MIPVEAVEEAAKIIYRTSGRKRVMSYEEARNACEAEAVELLEAAAPYIRAQALEDVAAEIDEGAPAYGQDGYADWLRERATTERDT